MDKELLDQIDDIIVNHYEDGHNYSRLELKEILDAIVEVMDSRK